MDVDCGYCFNRLRNDDYLECEECEQYIHVKCLKRPGTPGDFIGDIFFQFKCCNCTEDGVETFDREKLPWAIVIVLTIYNLSVYSKGLSHHGYFHWRTHIAHFIDKNWVNIMGPTVKRRKNWIGTISGTLSHNSPALFTSGSSLFNEAGWWKLTHNKTPKQNYDIFKRLRHEKSASDDIDIMSETSNNSLLGKRSFDEATDSQDSDIEDVPCSRTLPYMGRMPFRLKMSETNDDLLDFMKPDSDSNFLADMPLLSTQEMESLIPSFTDSKGNDDWASEFKNFDFDFESNENNSEEIFIEPRVVQVTNFQEADSQFKTSDEIKKEIENEQEDVANTEEEPYETKYVCRKSLFKTTNRPVKQPWEVDLEGDRDTENTDDFSGDKNIGLMNEYEENEIYKRLHAIMTCEAAEHLIEIPAWVRRYYRKLCVRRLQRSSGQPVFDLENYSGDKKVKQKNNDNPVVLDRFHHLLSGSNMSDKDISFNARLAGTCKFELFISPHTGRALHPFIYRNETTLPPWVKLMCELQYEVNGEMPTRASIDFCYVRPHHIAAVNALLQRMFWPGIDMSECLSYPDFSVVALYKKLVVGCAFLVPDVGHNEAYVSFMAVRPGWQHAGIATFMLYHLTQTCMGKDITLHVSATNSAICLYQKFGFKIEELILDFYDKFIPIDSKDSRHAFLLRLER